MQVQQVDFETYGKVMQAAGIPEQMVPVQILIQKGQKISHQLFRIIL
ncbi:hypothetical protein [Paenibacillus pabuli]|nr:hypothetical protein [Paenibacillus pabuli]UPK42572.1 hypothetical protein KET34_25855 [Paenibacillus pabuli]